MISGDKTDLNRIIRPRESVNAILDQNAAAIEGKNDHFIIDEKREIKNSQERLYEQRRQRVLSQFRTIEKIKQIETGTRNVVGKSKMQQGTQS